IDANSYTKAKERYNGELLKLQAELTPSSPAQTEFQRLTKSGIHLLEKLPSFYQRSTVQTKRDIVSSIFPEKLTISENKSRTQKINQAVLLISATDKGLRGKKTGQPFKNLELSRQVEANGFLSNTFTNLLSLVKLIRVA
ncbi:MAG TPA: hypothetical protein VF609_11815, partial [Flavisolibacter sp.]